VNTQLLIPAAGTGVRLGSPSPKALISVAGKPLIVRTLEQFVPVALARCTIIVTAPEALPEFERVLHENFPGEPFVFAQGGRERQHSVANGLACLNEDTDVVVIHDAARPFVTAESVQRSVEAARECGAATVAIPSADTILVDDGDGYLEDTPDRESLWACQTPQTFQVSVIRDAHEQAKRDGFLGTDDASLVRRVGGKVKLIAGSPLNFKVTTPDDLALAEAIVQGGLA
jgi:2-C-methyl-D-erythritol 4-phosphate cytidylyltransferase